MGLDVLNILFKTNMNDLDISFTLHIYIYIDQINHFIRRTMLQIR